MKMFFQCFFKKIAQAWFFKIFAYSVRTWLGLNLWVFSVLAIALERFPKYVVVPVVVSLAVSLGLLAHFNPSPFYQLIMLQFTASVLVLVLYFFIWFRRIRGFRLLTLIPSTPLTMLVVATIAGTNFIARVGWRWTLRNLLTPTFEIHLKKLSKPSVDELVDSVRKLSTNYKGAIFYTYSPLVVKGLLRKASLNPASQVSLLTQINPTKARKYREKPKPFKFYVLQW